ncbi:MAG: nucleotidyltransferase domain-containing protein [Bacteroidetes bacterium]|nr:nucleotidyltransferase domain-containing protein [Bacteroidota bacterium]
MVIHRVFDEVFRSWSHVAVLRTLVDTTTGRTGNEVARISGMQPRSALRALSALEELGIVHRQRGGRDHIFTLNRDHILVRNAVSVLYQSEKQFEEETIAFLSNLLKNKVTSALIFGSTARQEETLFSDLDICCITKDERQKEAVRSLINEKSPRLHREFGVRVSPIFFTVSEARAKRHTPLLKRIVKEGKLLTGDKLEKLIGS